MQTFLPYADFAECARVLDGNRINSQLNEILVIFKSLVGFYPPRKNGKVGWEGHTVVEMWRGHELQLGRLGLAYANEFLRNRDLPKSTRAKSLELRKKRYQMWRDMVELMEIMEFPDMLPVLIGDEEFHSAFRSLLKYKETQAVTFKKWKHGEYPDHSCTRNLLPRKASWRRQNYIGIWEFFGMPDIEHYASFGWDEEPTDERVFYREDRIPQMYKEIQRKKDKPNRPLRFKK